MSMNRNINKIATIINQSLQKRFGIVIRKYNKQSPIIFDGFSERRFLYFYNLLDSLKEVDGDIVECGVWKGGSMMLAAKTLMELDNTDYDLYLFDTFEGLPKTNDNDLFVQKGWLHDTSLESVKNYLSDFKNTHFLKGIFPETAEPISDKKFSFIHLDTNLYQSTLDALEFFWPRMVIGGRIVSHDYNASSMPGVKKAFMEFFRDQPEKIIEIADSQVMVIK